MTTVSLSHIAGGIAVITHGAVPDWQAWGCAIGLDANYIAMEMAGVVAAMRHVRDQPSLPPPGKGALPPPGAAQIGQAQRRALPGPKGK
jgi:hypothetical protein